MLARVAVKSLARRAVSSNVQAVPASTISGKDYLARKNEPYTVRQEAKGRFVSPHVDIYDFPLAAISSVTMRATGAALTVGFYGASIYALFGGDLVATMDAYKTAVPALVLAATKFTVGFPLAYHYVAGLRHLYVDRNPAGVNTESFKMSSRVRPRERKTDWGG